MFNLLTKLPIPWEEEKVQWVDPNRAYTLYEVRTQWDYELEGYFLAHCLGTKDAEDFNLNHRVLSLRDQLGIPHCTVLLKKNGHWSPYGQSSDLLTKKPLEIKGKYYQVLQVRGREDKVARWEYYNLILNWYLSHHGKLQFDKSSVREVLKQHQDTDLKYHYGYMLDESVNQFDWSYWEGDKARDYRRLGLSL